MRFTKTILAASLLLSSTAFAAEGAATLSNQQGTVLVNQGEEFVTATEAQALKAGDRVMVMEGGSAQVTFGNGCVLPLAAGSMVVVSDGSDCAGSVAAVQQIGPTYAQAVGAPRDERCDDEDETNNDFDNDGTDDCPVAAYVDGSATGWTANNRGAGWIFGTWTAGIAYALIEGDYSINPVSP
jgi:hypothetical protein